MIETIFEEYQRMRDKGVSSRDALRQLRTYIEPLPRLDKHVLGDHITAWEKDRKKSAIKPITQKQRSSDARKKVIQPIWTECPSCKAKNRVDEVFCYACGLMLSPEQETVQKTRKFRSATSDIVKNDYFGEDSVLILDIRDMKQRLEIRPQLKRGEVTVGRSQSNSNMRPDLDLTLAGGEKLGVSRLHLTITWDEKTKKLSVYDMGSSNGSYLNGEQLVPSKPRLLRSGDELRLARMVMKVTYEHPGEEIQE